MAQALHPAQPCLDSEAVEYTSSIQKKHLYVGWQEPTVPFVCLILSPASRDTYLLLQLVHCTGNALFSFPSVLQRHGILQILL